jgi:glycosyltransferase involved in cell wall biosynthesis
MTGFREDVPVLMHACNVIVHTSTAPEPFGRVIVEGMIAGRPVIATNVGGPAEIIRDQISGVLVSPHSSTDLENAIRLLMNDRPLYKKISQCGYRQARNIFGSGDMVDTVVKTLHQVIATNANLRGESHRDPGNPTARNDSLKYHNLFLTAGSEEPRQYS